MSPWLDDPEHWWSRAEEARSVASEMKNDHAVHLMLRVVESYELLAKMSEQLQRPREAPIQPTMTLKDIATFKRRI